MVVIQALSFPLCQYLFPTCYLQPEETETALNKGMSGAEWPGGGKAGDPWTSQPGICEQQSDGTSRA